LGKKPKVKHKESENGAVAKKINALLIVGAVVIAAGIVWYVLRDPVMPERAALPKPNVTTMSPDQFSGRIRSSYEAAKEVPEVLAQLPCYCGCMMNSGHKNNLDCFRDNHGVECTMCQDIALDAREMWNDGFDIDRIRETVKQRYGRYAAVHE
jgi:hypothetical protein